MFIRDGETIGRARSNGRNKRRQDSQTAVFERRSRTRSASPIGSHEPRSHDAGRAMSKFHRISATPAIKNAEREEETLPMAGACQRVRAGRSRSDFIHGSQRRNANNENRRRYAEMCTLGLYFADGHAATAGRRKSGKLRSSALHARVLRAAHDPGVRPLCVVSPTDRPTGITEGA